MELERIVGPPATRPPCYHKVVKPLWHRSPRLRILVLGARFIEKKWAKSVRTGRRVVLAD